MPKHTLLLLIVVAIALAACQGQNQASPTMTAPTVVIQPTTALTEETPAITDVVQQAVAGAPPGCTVISPQKTPGPTEQSVFPPVTEKDWSTGPKGAAITLIEYSDFQ